MKTEILRESAPKLIALDPHQAERDVEMQANLCDLVSLEGGVWPDS